MSETAISKVAQANLAVMTWTPEQKDLIKRTIAREATDDELSLFLHIAKQSGLDPLRRQIHFIKAGGRFYTVADINGLQARAAREADYEGISHAVVYERDDFAINNVTGEVVRHTSNPLGSNGRIVGAWAVVRRKGLLPFVSVVRFDEYHNPSNQKWKSMPAVMIDKCAKSTALRLAYPEQLGNIYEEAELAKEEREVNPPPSATPRTAAEAKAALVAKVEEKKPTHSEAVKMAGAIADSDMGKVPPAPVEETVLDHARGKALWAQAVRLGQEHGVSEKDVGAKLVEITGKKSKASITPEAVEKFRRWLADEPVDAQVVSEVEHAANPV